MTLKRNSITESACAIMTVPLFEARMSKRAEAFEHWIRTSFVQMNTELENLYFAQEHRAQVIGRGDPIKASHGAEILDRASSDAQPGARRRSQELYIAPG